MLKKYTDNKHVTYCIEHKSLVSYSITSMARPRMARLPWMILTLLFLSPYKILPIAQEKKYLEIFSYFIMELYVVCTH